MKTEPELPEFYETKPDLPGVSTIDWPLEVCCRPYRACRCRIIGPSPKIERTKYRFVYKVYRVEILTGTKTVEIYLPMHKMKVVMPQLLSITEIYQKGTI